ncbi:DNA primase [Xenorhabdus cabanillasii JM26]|nr:DNA primase [Xenorhabdus cabanillasii JM26]
MYTISQLHEGVVLAAIDESNLLTVAELVRKQWPESKIILAADNDWQLFIEVTGEGGSAKSVFTYIATLLAGKHNTASGNMKALDEARGRYQFVGKSLITLPNQVKYVGEGAGIKAITGGDLIEVDGKYEKQFSTIIKAVVLATNNEPMSFTERNGGIARRRVIFPSKNQRKIRNCRRESVGNCR